MAKVLAVSDFEEDYVYRAAASGVFKDVDFIVSCGDVSSEYLGYIISMVNRNLYYVRGNHQQITRRHENDNTSQHWGGIDLHLHTRQAPGDVILAGIEGSLAYNFGPQQYTQQQMWGMVYRLVPRLFINYMRHNRFLDVLVTHTPPWGINDADDLPHQGIKAFRWLIEAFRPRWHLHGHARNYLGQRNPLVVHAGTQVINVSGYQLIDL